jgi:hypothetical protein
MDASVARGQSCATNAREAVAEVHAALARPDLALVVFFCSSHYDLDAVGDEMSHRFDGVPVIGCTTAGEIGPGGCRRHSLVGAGFAASEFAVAAGGLEHVQDFRPDLAGSLTQELMQQFEGREPTPPDGAFALLLVDGTSVREESITLAFQQQLGSIPLVGGSAGDDLRFEETFVYFDGSFHRDAAALALVRTALPFEAVRIQHFVPTDRRVVVTAADAPQRVVYEMEGIPAAECYAALIGTDVDDLDPVRFADAPVVVMIAGTNYVRSIQKANPDGSLTFFSAIDEGLVLRAAAGVDIVGNLVEAFDDIRGRLGTPQVVIAFDCILRRLEMERRHVVERVEAVFAENNVVGFNTYGEQYCAVHVNQTLTGIALGWPDGA